MTPPNLPLPSQKTPVLIKPRSTETNPQTQPAKPATYSTNQVQIVVQQLETSMGQQIPQKYLSEALQYLHKIWLPLLHNQVSKPMITNNIQNYVSRFIASFFSYKHKQLQQIVASKHSVATEQLPLFEQRKLRNLFLNLTDYNRIRYPKLVNLVHDALSIEKPNLITFLAGEGKTILEIEQIFRPFMFPEETCYQQFPLILKNYYHSDPNEEDDIDEISAKLMFRVQQTTEEILITRLQELFKQKQIQNTQLSFEYIQLQRAKAELEFIEGGLRGSYN